MSAGKGDKPRPIEDRQKFRDNWDLAFPKDEDKEEEE